MNQRYLNKAFRPRNIHPYHYSQDNEHQSAPQSFFYNAIPTSILYLSVHPFQVSSERIVISGLPILIICEGCYSGPIYRWGNWVSRRVKYIQAYLILLHFALLHFTDSVFCFVLFYRLKVCGNPAWSKSISIIFPTAHFMSLSHFHNYHNISNFFIIIIFVMVTSGLWSLMLLLHLFQGATNHTHTRQQT